MLTNDVCSVADFEKFSAYAFYSELPQDPPCQDPHGDQNALSVSEVSDSESEAKNGSTVETELENDQEMLELAQKHLSKFQEALRLKVRS